MDDTKDVQLLTLVLVDALDLDIEKRSRVDLDIVVLQNVLGETDLLVSAKNPLNTSRVLCYLVLILDVAELLPELFIVDKGLKLVEQGQVLQELVTAKFGCNEL